jgi:peptidyl-prolyl cis-trans isomerase SurA
VCGVRRVTLLTAPVVALLLSACGSSGPQPGTALSLDGQRVSTTHVQDVASRYCDALARVGTTASTQTVQNQVVGALAARLAAERFADARGLEPGAAYQTSVTQLRNQLADFDPETQDAIIEVEGAQSYVDAVTQPVGEQSFTQWLEGQHMKVNPVYGVSLTGSRFAHVDASLSVAASEQAKSAVQAAADPSAAPAAGGRSCG